MEQKELKIKVGLDIIIKKEIQGEEKKCNCKIVGWDENKILILKPIEKLDQQFSTMGVLLTIGYIDEGILFGFKSKLLSVVELLESIFLILQYPENYETIFLRKEERFRVNFEGTFKLVLDDGGIAPSQVRDCNIIDLSSEGCGILSRYPLQTGENISLSFNLPLHGKIKDLVGIIVNEFKLRDGEFKYGFKFGEDITQKSIISSYLSVIPKFRILDNKIL